MINKKERINYLFERIEKNSLEDVEDFFEMFPEFLKHKDQIRSINDWTPAYYCARFGYIDLLKYFFEKVQMNDDKSFLLLLSIHSGSLPVMYYLFSDAVQTYELMMMLYSSCNLGKINLGIFILLRGAMVYDDVSLFNNENSKAMPLCYNMSYEQKGDRKLFYNSKGNLIFEETDACSTIIEFQSKKNQKEKFIFILSQGISKMKEKLKMISLFRVFQIAILTEISKKGFIQKDDRNSSKTKYTETLSIIDKSEFLKKIFDSYIYLKR